MVKFASNLVDFTDLGDGHRWVLNSPTSVLSIFWQSFSISVAATVHLSTFFEPLFEASVHDADVAGSEVAQHPGSSAHSRDAIRVIANDLIVFADAESVHMLIEHLHTGQSVW